MKRGIMIYGAAVAAMLGVLVGSVDAQTPSKGITPQQEKASKDKAKKVVKTKKGVKSIAPGANVMAVKKVSTTKPTSTAMAVKKVSTTKPVATAMAAKKVKKAVSTNKPSSTAMAAKKAKKTVSTTKPTSSAMAAKKKGVKASGKPAAQTNH